MAVVIQEFEVRPAATPAPATAHPAPAANAVPSPAAPTAADLQRHQEAARERALRLFAH